MHAKRQRVTAPNTRHKRELVELLGAAEERADREQQRANGAESRERKAAVEFKLVREKLENEMEAAIKCTETCMTRYQRDTDDYRRQLAKQRDAWQAKVQSVQAEVDVERQRWAKEKEAMHCIRAAMEEDADAHREQIGTLQEERVRAMLQVEQLKEQAVAAEDEAQLRRAASEYELQSVRKLLEVKNGELNQERRDKAEQREHEANLRASLQRQFEAQLSARSSEQEMQHKLQTAETKQRTEDVEQQMRDEIDALTQRTQHLESEASKQSEAAAQQALQHAVQFYEQARSMGAELRDCNEQLQAERERIKQLLWMTNEWLEQQKQEAEERRKQLSGVCESAARTKLSGSRLALN